MKIKFQADSDLNGDIVTGVLRRIPEIDFQSADEAGIRGLSDNEVLAMATTQMRLLVSHDRRTMPFFFAEFIRERHTSGVLIISQRLKVARAIEELILIWEASESHEYVDLIQTLPL